jgi:hypothetical protein
VVDRDGLENRCACKRTVGSNPTLSAILRSYVAVEDEAGARKLELYFKSGSGKAFAKTLFQHRRVAP